MPSRLLERAIAADDEAARALLRRTPMEGDIRLGFEREPNGALSAAIEGDRHHLFVAREADGSISGMCSRAVRPVYFNGDQRRIGYLGQLRSEQPGVASREMLRAGFAACRETRRPDELPFDFTSIMADNARARRLLERGLPGLPRYAPIGAFRTFVVPVVARKAEPLAWDLRVEQGSIESAAEIAAFLQSQYRNFQLAPVWSADDLLSNEVTRDLSLDDFVLVRRGNAIVGCAALWDQSSFRQSVVRGYAPLLTSLRGVANAWYGLTGQPRLPAVGERLRLAMLSHFAVDGDDPDVAMALVERIVRIAASRAIELLALGLEERCSLVPRFRARLRARILESILYAVLYDEGTEPALDGRPIHVEVATL